MATEEKKAEATLEVAQAIPEVPPQPTVEQLQAVITKLTADVESARRESKADKEYGRKTKVELDKQRGIDDKITNVESRLQIVTDMLADLVDKGMEGDEVVEPQPRERKSEKYLARLKPEADAEKVREQTQFRQAAMEADGLAKSISLTMDKSPELRNAYLLFRVGDYQNGLEEVKKLVESKQVKPPEAETKPKESEEERIDRLAEEKSRRRMEELGQLSTDISRPSGGGGKTWTMAEIQAMSTVGVNNEFKRNFPNGFADIFKGMEEGRIK